MSINDYPLYSQHKELFKPTAHKSDFSFSSPQEDPSTISKQGLHESRRLDTFRNRTQLFADLKQNTNIVSMINKSYSKQFVDQMRNDQRMEVQKLLLEISRLHDLLEDQQKVHRHAINRLKEESEQISLLRISNLKQSQFSQIELIQVQLKKTKEALEEKHIKYEELEKITTKKIESLVNQNQVLRADLKAFVEKKNLEIHQLRNQFAKENQDSSRKQNQSITQLKALADKELKKVIKRLEQKQEAVAYLTSQQAEAEKQNKKLQQMFENERRQLDEKIERVINDQRERRDSLTQSIKNFYLSEAQLSHQNLEQQRQLFVSEISQLMKIIGIKDEQSRRNLVYMETQKIDYRLQIKAYREENESLKKLVSNFKKQSLQQIQHLKVKMGVLHKADIEALVGLYEAKIQSLTKDLQYASGETERAGQQVRKEREALYELKKKYDYTISILHQEISQLRIGASHHQKQMKQKLENQKSMMMLTSRNFIKENQAKTNNIRFYEEELRKLRQLLQIQAEEVEQSQKNVEQKIKLAEDQLSRLSNKIIEVKSEAEENEKKLKATIEQKNKQIKRLNQILNVPKHVNKLDDGPMQELKKLDEEITKKQDQLRSLKNRCGDLQSQIRMVKSENERLIIENQINTEDAKKKYKTISDKNLADMKAFYDRRMQELENDKRELGRLNTSQSQQITELIKKYKELEEGLKQLMKQTKKRSDLQARIIALGMDNNLVKNMAELFHH